MSDRINQMRGTPPPKSSEEAWKEHYRLQEQYINELENRLRTLWDKYDLERNHYMERIKRLEKAGDQLAKWADRNTPVTILNDWKQAKEDKP